MRAARRHSEVGYSIEKSATIDSNWNEVYRTNLLYPGRLGLQKGQARVIGYFDNTLIQGQTYFFRVRSYKYDLGGNEIYSDFSNTDRVIAPERTFPQAPRLSLWSAFRASQDSHFIWSGASNQVLGYSLERAIYITAFGGGCHGFTEIGRLEESHYRNSIHYLDRSIIRGWKYCYRVRAYFHSLDGNLIYTPYSEIVMFKKP